MQVNWNLILTILLTVLPVLSVLLILLKKFFPVVDPYFYKGAVILDEIDDILDGILLEYPENKLLNTVEDVVEKLLKELSEAGYKVNEKDEKKIENHIKAKLKREEGTQIKWEDGKLRLEYNHNF
jgi:hypothetical protein